MTETLVRRKPSRSAWVRRLVLLAVSGVITVRRRPPGGGDRLGGGLGRAQPPDAGGSRWCSSRSLVVRQVLNALPLALYIPGVSAYRATINDLGRDPDVDGRAAAQRPGHRGWRCSRPGACPTAKALAGARDEHPDLLHRPLLRAGGRASCSLAVTGRSARRSAGSSCSASRIAVAILVARAARRAQRAAGPAPWERTGAPDGAAGAHRTSTPTAWARGVPGLPRATSPPASATGSRGRWWRSSGCSSRTSRCWSCACASWASTVPR